MTCCSANGGDVSGRLFLIYVGFVLSSDVYKLSPEACRDFYNEKG